MQGKGHAGLGDRKIAIDTIEDRGARLAAALVAGGVAQDDCVAILMRNDFCYLEAQVATQLIGAYAVPLNWHLADEEVAFILEDCAARVLLVHADLLRRVRHRVPSGVRVIAATTPREIALEYDVAPADCALPDGVEAFEALVARTPPLAEGGRAAGTRGSIIYTSGTTGRPKGVKRQPVEGDAARRYAQLNADWWDLRPGVRTVMAGPMYHSAPNVYARSVVTAGGSITLMPRFDAERLLQLIERDCVSHLHVVPTMFIRLLRLPQAVRERYDLRSLQFVVHGAAPCPPDVKRAMIEWWGPVIHEYYGATETGMITRSSSAEWLERRGTVGRAWPGREVRIYDDEGGLLGPGQVGNIYASLVVVPAFTYHNAPAQHSEIERDGLVTNGDVGYLDEDGFLFLVDRKKDMVISGGVNIYPAEIEGVLAMHPQVADSAVIGIPDAEFGEKVAAFVLPRGGEVIDEAELANFLRQRMAGFKVPRVFNFVEALPRDESGKLMKRKLRDRYWAGAQRQI